MEAQRNSTPLDFVCLNIANLNFWLACSGLSVQKYTEFTAGSWRMKFHWGLIALLLNPEADDCQAGGKEMYLTVFVASGQFLLPEEIVLLNLENEQQFCTDWILESL